MMHRRDFLGAAASLAALTTVPSAWAQAEGTAFVITGFPAGGLGDLDSRPLVEKLRGNFAPAVLMEARPGAGGRIAAEYVKRARPDGMTILQMPSGAMVLYPHIYKKLPYDPLTDFIPVTTVCAYASAMCAGPGLPAEIATVPQYLAWARANPAQANYGVPAAGSPLHFAGMMLAGASGVDLRGVPYKGGAPLRADLLGGQIPVSFNVVSEVAQDIRSARVRALAVTTRERWPFLPDVPTFAEAGFGDVALDDWLGWFVPAGTPMDVVNKLSAGVAQAMEDGTTMSDVLNQHALKKMYQTPQEFAAIVKRDYARWAPVVKATGFTGTE